MKLQGLHIICCIICLWGCKTPEARRPVSVSSGSFIQESIQRNKKLAAREEAQIKRLIAQDTSHTYLTSQNGFWYYYRQKDTMATQQPVFGDVVTFNYNIKDLNQNTIYSETEIDTVRYAIDKEELFQGLREGLKLMKEGETVTFLFPSYQAYGYYGDNDKIGTNIPLVSTVTLHTITKQSTKEN
ncbi:gliding motility-associated peptidyl-prolyl isomerase GldI [Aquimarina sp. ERC-38]|uniref:gliding motility-associated peptidyl-prolyl isomerase GldI n=1 Tax=Aquimarina sp. ERC-38 TaxID=2949996 RepID=UPI0022473483|nr:gliding motility-associated peptidyl-prolyl isomerase GldI [Aquimarina sp. ERC-38]UZO80405.1 gliding motility-associated peptidyl-prolyl isomerase GldI [Aquimarina sp. ERC-38]